MRSTVSSFKFQYPIFSLRSSGSRLLLLLHLPVIYILSSTFVSPITCFRRQFLRNMWPIQLAFLRFILDRIFLSSLTLCNTSSFLTRSVQMISILFQHHITNLSRYFWPTFRSVQFQHHTKLCSKCSTLLVSSFNVSPIFWWQQPSSSWMLHLLRQSWIWLYVI